MTSDNAPSMTQSSAASRTCAAAGGAVAATSKRALTSRAVLGKRRNWASAFKRISALAARRPSAPASWRAQQKKLRWRGAAHRGRRRAGCPSMRWHVGGMASGERRESRPCRRHGILIWRGNRRLSARMPHLSASLRHTVRGGGGPGRSVAMQRGLSRDRSIIGAGATGTASSLPPAASITNRPAAPSPSTCMATTSYRRGERARPSAASDSRLPSDSSRCSAALLLRLDARGFRHHSAA